MKTIEEQIKVPAQYPDAISYIVPDKDEVKTLFEKCQGNLDEVDNILNERASQLLDILKDKDQLSKQDPFWEKLRGAIKETVHYCSSLIWPLENMILENKDGSKDLSKERDLLDYYDILCGHLYLIQDNCTF